MRQFFRAIYRRWCRITARLRQQRVLLGVAIALWLGLVEPLACIIHCELVTLLGGVSATAQHNHDMAMMGMDHTHSADHEPADTCPWFGSPLDSAATAPQPFHEMISVLPLLVVVASRLLLRRLPPLLFPMQHRAPPLLKPPILLAWHPAA